MNLRIVQSFLFEPVTIGRRNDEGIGARQRRPTFPLLRASFLPVRWRSLCLFVPLSPSVISVSPYAAGRGRADDRSGRSGGRPGCERAPVRFLGEAEVPDHGFDPESGIGGGTGTG